MMVEPPPGHKRVAEYFKRGFFLITLPAFHVRRNTPKFIALLTSEPVAGLSYSLLVSAHFHSVPIYPLPGPPPSLPAIVEAIQNNNDMTWGIFPPVAIDDLGKNPELLDIVSDRLEYIFYTGGSVPKKTGDLVASRLEVYQVLGSSECGSFPLLKTPEHTTSSENWEYVQIDPCAGAEFQYRFGDLYELVIIRHKNDAVDLERFQPVFCHFDIPYYETRDLFRKHPGHDNLWTHVSRIDHVIVFMNGEKTIPVSFEHEVAMHPEVRSVLVVGQQRFEASLLVELTSTNSLSPQKEREFIDRIWPIVKDANTRCPRHACVSKSKIMIVEPAIPMARAGKGTVQRQATITLYQEKIDRL
jgi:hypothetical protein